MMMIMQFTIVALLAISTTVVASDLSALCAAVNGFYDGDESACYTSQPRTGLYLSSQVCDAIGGYASRVAHVRDWQHMASIRSGIISTGGHTFTGGSKHLTALLSQTGASNGMEMFYHFMNTGDTDRYGPVLSNDLANTSRYVHGGGDTARIVDFDTIATGNTGNPTKNTYTYALDGEYMHVTKDPTTVSDVICEYYETPAIRHGRQIHARIVAKGRRWDVKGGHVWTSLMNMNIASCMQMCGAETVCMSFSSDDGDGCWLGWSRARGYIDGSEGAVVAGVFADDAAYTTYDMVERTHWV